MHFLKIHFWPDTQNRDKKISARGQKDKEQDVFFSDMKKEIYK
jgi:hypothetical protein